MNFQKNIFFNQWKKSIKRNKFVVAIKEEPFEILITFSQSKKRLYNKIHMWLIENDYEFEDLELIYNNWTSILIKCPF